jgi:MoaA/NifB/PqqE/SkfB family radical SAM enzyme
MNTIDKIQSFVLVLKAKFFNKRIPIAVRIELTNRCPNRCVYCNIWNAKMVEPSKEEIFSLLRELKELGTKKVSFSGGEPMLRPDIGEIITYCKTLGISPEMNTSGILVSKRIKEISSLDLIKISIDGPEDIHDFIVRRKGSYKEAVSALEATTSYGIKTVITTTITKYNINHLDHIIDLAKKYNCFVAFQPVKKMVYSRVEVDNLLPDIEEYRQAIQKLINLKLSGNGYMRNSLAGLKHIYYFPNYPKLKCAAGRLFMIIDVDGTVYPCDRVDYEYKGSLPNYKEVGLKNAINMLPEVNCSGCGFCGALELSFLLNFKLNGITTIPKLIK